MRVSVGINQISFAPDEYVATYSAAMHEAGAPEIMLYDGGSGMGPEAYAFMVRLVCEHAPDAVVGVHTHNMFDFAVATALESAKAGARVLEVSVNGYCAASGQADLAATTMALNALYGAKTGIDLSKLTPLARLAEKIVGYEIAWNHPVTGREVFNWGGTEFVIQELKVDPLIHWCIEPFSRRPVCCPRAPRVVARDRLGRGRGRLLLLLLRPLHPRDPADGTPHLPLTGA